MYFAAEVVRQGTRTVLVEVCDSVAAIVTSPASSGAVELAGMSARGAAAAAAGAARRSAIAAARARM